jgi:hypothetical protein
LDWGSACCKAATYTGKHRINANIYAVSGIRNHDPSVRAGEDISCHCERRCEVHTHINKEVIIIIIIIIIIVVVVVVVVVVTCRSLI